MKLPIVGVVDERFLTHRLRSTSIAGLTGTTLAAGLFLYNLYGRHVIRWDLFSIVVTVAVVKFAVLLWYRITD